MSCEVLFSLGIYLGFILMWVEIWVFRFVFTARGCLLSDCLNVWFL